MFSNPQHNIDQFSLGDDMRVADFGTGSGAYALAAARAVGGDGKVFAIDVRQENLTRLKKEADGARLHNIEVLRGDLEKLGGSGLRDGAVDAVIASNILFQLKDKRTFFKEVKRVLASGGRLLLVDWAQSFGGAGPEASAVVREEEAKTFALDEGFTYLKSIDAGAYHYGLIFKRQ
ncbi:MAG: methyltransferase domain-containing protein [Parcubacteria group bacterium]|nr:methyltransferase domain-containing protein [Parcubacteria group bacterium]